MSERSQYESRSQYDLRTIAPLAGDTVARCPECGTLPWTHVGRVVFWCGRDGYFTADDVRDALTRRPPPGA